MIGCFKSGGVDGHALQAMLQSPTGVVGVDVSDGGGVVRACDTAKGEVYVMEKSGRSLRRMGPEGMVKTVALNVGLLLATWG